MMQCVEGEDMTVNQEARDIPVAGPAREALARNRFDSILETIGRTPVVRIKKLAPAQVCLYVKIEAFNPTGSVKDRLALGVIEDAERAGQLRPGQTVIEATSGNTGIGLAMVCAEKGYPLVVTMAENFSGRRHTEADRPGSACERCARAGALARARPKGRDLCRHFSRGYSRRRLAGVRGSSVRCQRPVHLARHGRTLSEHSSVQRHPR